MKSARSIKAAHWLILGALAASTAQFTACSSKFSSCTETRSCSSSTGGEAGVGGEAGSGGATSESSGGTNEAGSGAAGDAPESGSAGTPNEVGGSPTGGSAGSGQPPLTCADELSACGGACVDTQQDPKNCGRCGHDCLGGECDLGKCQPIVIAPSQANLTDIITDGTYVYWSGSDAALTNFYIARRRVDLSDAVKTIATAETRAEGLALSSAHVYWLGNGHVRMCDAPNCNGGATDFEPTVKNCFHLLSTPTSLFWSCQTDYGKNNGSLWSAATTASTPVNLEPSSKNPRGLASDTDAVYWVNAAGFNAQGTLDSDGAVWRLKLSNGTTTKLVSGLPQEMTQIAVGGGRLYFEESGAQAIYSVPLPNGAVNANKIADFKGGGIVADDKALYWADSVGGSVLTCPHTGCASPEVIAPGQVSPQALAQDALSIYWTSGNPGLGPIQRLAK